MFMEDIHVVFVALILTLVLLKDSITQERWSCPS